MSNFPFGQHAGGGSINWYFSQFLTTALTDTLETIGSTCLTKYNVCLMPGWPLCRWMDIIQLKSCLLGNTALAQYGSTTALLMRSNHRCGTLVRPSVWLCSDLTRTASTDSSYSLTRLLSASSCCLISISLAALVPTLAFPVRVSVILLCTHAESVWRCNIVTFHISAMFTPFSTVSSSVKFMCCVSLSFHNQLASFMAVPSWSSDALVARELASTQTSSSEPSTHIFPHTGSSWYTLVMTYFIIVVNETSSYFVIPTLCHACHSPLNECCSNPEPFNHREVPD